jgi:hypothetical protein
MLCGVVCRRGDIKRLEDPVFNASVSVAERPWRRRSLYQDTTASSKVMEEGSIVLCWRLVGKMLMRLVPGARGAQTYLAVVGSWRDRMMLQRLGWQWRASLLMMHALSKSVVAHRCSVLMAILDSNTRCRWMNARSPRGLPRVFWIVSLAPHTR